MDSRSIHKSAVTEVLGGALVFFGLYLTSLYSYLLFHSLAEIFSIVVACSIFFLSWNSRRFLDNSYLLFIGIAYLFIGGLDLLHTLAYKGMGVFPGRGANLPTQLWIGARYMESAALAIAPLLLGRRLNVIYVAFGCGAVVSLLLASIFGLAIFPACFVEGVGLTPFKKGSEYVIASTLLASVILLYQRRRHFDPGVLHLLSASIIATIVAELAFTFYVSVYGLSNLIGHFFKIISFYLIYKAIIETGLLRPYKLLFRELKQSEEALRRESNFVESLIQTAQAIVLVLDMEGRIVRYNKYMEELSGYPLDQAQGKDWFTTFLPERDRARIQQLFFKAKNDLQTRGDVHPILIKGNGERKIEWFDKTIKDADGKSIGVLCIGQDVTQRKVAEEEREKLIADLQQALAEVKRLSGLLPICAGCKKIRDDKGYWKQIEDYIRDHSEADFSHGICPQCAQERYRDLFENNVREK